MAKCWHSCERIGPRGRPRRNFPKGCLRIMAVPRRRKTRRSTWFLPAALAVLVLTITSGLFLAPAATTTAAAQTVGNAVINRPYLDGASDFVIIDRNNTATAPAALGEFQVWAKNANKFRVLVVSPADEITYVSEEFTPAGTGAQSFFPASLAFVQPGDALALYFPGAGSIAYLRRRRGWPLHRQGPRHANGQPDAHQVPRRRSRPQVLHRRLPFLLRHLLRRCRPRQR